ncbi:COG4315 family predicted lipoprotein [Oceanivirga salmonicida]|uniref:COG4315 family predicted lipoprotein n=1 Tax=Oceanivirga salmonicida TaxID=1769291 RepID=UPI000AB672D3|nr:hypothetical protein [Oceanivirga salmonicida]
MRKKLLGLMLVSVLAVACNSNDTKESVNATDKMHVMKAEENHSMSEMKKEMSPFSTLEDGTLVDSENLMTLYTFDNDKENESVCDGDCAEKWPPYLVKNKEMMMMTDEISIVNRKDGSMQWAYKGKPLYFWSGDEKSGDKNGENLGNVWHTVKYTK